MANQSFVIKRKTTPTEIVTQPVNSEIRVYHNFESGKIVVELYIDGTLFWDWDIEDREVSQDWKKYFTKMVEEAKADLIKKGEIKEESTA